MRLREMYFLIKQALDKGIEPKIDVLESEYDWSNPRELYDILSPLRMIPCVDHVITEVNKMVAATIPEKRYILDAKRKNFVIHLYNDLSIQMKGMLSMCEVIGLESDTLGFDVKLPPDITLAEAAHCMSELDKIFSQCPLFQNEEPVKFKGVDIGSVWLSFTVAGVAALTVLGMVAELVDKAVIIRSHWLTCKQMEKDYRRCELANEQIESLLSIQKTAHDAIIKREATELAEKHEVIDPEDRERLKFTLERLSVLMENGLEIYANISAPHEVKAVFPPVSQQKLPYDVLKQLEEKSSSDS